MKSTSRLRVLSDRIPRVLVFVYFCRGLSGNKEEKPTCQDYIGISTHRAIFYHLEDSRSHGKEAEPERGQAQGARPGSLGARPPVGAKSGLFRSGYSTDLLDQEKHSTTSPIDPKTHRRGGLYKQGPPGPWRRHEEIIIETEGCPRRKTSSLINISF